MCVLRPLVAGISGSQRGGQVPLQPVAAVPLAGLDLVRPSSLRRQRGLGVSQLGERPICQARGDGQLAQCLIGQGERLVGAESLGLPALLCRLGTLFGPRNCSRNTVSAASKPLTTRAISPAATLVSSPLSTAGVTASITGTATRACWSLPSWRRQ